mmetsp:Transcript_35652/g.76024  ORF Transcript_35652/g.76024 Transcript_35652/m.76024 type:complete len:384 (+) Transcript_35652:663-1814(+)
MALGLHESSHHAQSGIELPTLVGCHAWDDRMVAKLAGTNAIRVSFSDDEVVPSVLQSEAASVWHDACAEALVVRIDEGARVAPLVGGAEVDRVGACFHLTGEAVRHHAFRLLFAVEELRPTCRRSLLTEQPLGGVSASRVGAELQRVGEGQSKGLRLSMQRGCGHPGLSGRALQQVQSHQGRDALRWWGALPKPQFPPIGGADGLGKDGLVGGQVLGRHDAASLLQRRYNGLPDAALVETFLRSLFAQRSEGFGQVRITEDLSRFGCFSIGKQGGGLASRAVLQAGPTRVPELRGAVGDGEAILGEFDGRGQNLRQALRAPSLNSALPSGCGAWDSGANSVQWRQVLPPFHLRQCLHDFQRQGARRTSATLKALDLLRGPVVE